MVDLFRTQALPATPVPEEEVTYQRFSLEVIAGPDEGKKGTFGQEAVQVGTARNTDFPVTDATVSRYHIKIETQHGVFSVTDLNSTNGTYLGGHRIRSAFLEGDSVLLIGNTKLRFQPLSDAAHESVPVRDRLGPLIGSSIAMRKLYAMVERIARTDMPVIVEGETGTGKDLLARTLHALSDRRDQPFEVLDCGSVPETLIQSELFGHVRGAYTGADRDRAGIFERADGGTVFLDELGELRLDLQPKLLRVLETSEIRRVGGNEPIKVDVRIVCATHRSIRDLINQGKFREDLYYRLAGCKIDMPALRDRRQDIALLTQSFLDELREQGQADVPDRIAPETLKVLASRSWPGNIRQLRNAVRRAAVMGFDDLLSGENVAETTRVPTVPGSAALGPGQEILPLKDAKDAFERQYLVELMARFPGDLDAAATASDMHPKSLARLLRKYGLGRASLDEDDT